MVRILSSSSDPPHIVPPTAHVPRAMREAVNPVPLICVNSMPASSVHAHQSHFCGHLHARSEFARMSAPISCTFKRMTGELLRSIAALRRDRVSDRRTNARQKTKCRHFHGREIPSLPILYTSDVRFIPSFTAAPDGPPITHFV